MSEITEKERIKDAYHRIKIARAAQEYLMDFYEPLNQGCIVPDINAALDIVIADIDRHIRRQQRRMAEN